MQWSRVHIVELSLPALTLLFGLQLLRMLAASLVGVDLTFTDLSLYMAAPILVASLALLVNRILGPNGALALTAGGTALARMAEQVIFSPVPDLALAVLGSALFALFLPVYCQRILGRGAETGGLFGFSILLGFALDTSIRGSLNLVDLSWRQEPWALATVIILVAAQMAALSAVLAKGLPIRMFAVGGQSVVLLTLPALLVLVLEVLVFQNLGRQTILSPLPQSGVLAWAALGNTIGIAVGTAVLARRPTVRTMAVSAGVLLVAAILVEQWSGLPDPFILAGQASMGLATVLAGIAFGSGVRPSNLIWTPAVAGFGVLLALTVPFYLYIGTGLKLLPYNPGLATALVGATLLYVLSATVTMVRSQADETLHWTPVAIAMALLILPSMGWVGGNDLVARPSPTGIPVAALANFDGVVTDLMDRWQVAGGALAVAKDGRLVLARGYGLADVERGKPVQPDSLFRLASISKPITSAAILKLVDQGQLELDAKAFTLLDHLQTAPKSEKDPRIGHITVLQALQHSGGWDRRRSFDPMFIPNRAAREVGDTEPAGCETVIRFMQGQTLSFDPGTEYVYSNFGYCVLGRVIEQATGMPYQEYVKTQVLEPMGIKRMRIGSSLLDDRADGEVRYYAYPGAPLAKSVFPNVRRWVPRPYGGFYLEAMDSHGGWIGSAIDLMRFVTAVDGSRTTPFGQPEAVALAVSRPDPPLWRGSDYYYGMGWNVRPVDSDAVWWHSGSLEGTATILVRTHDGHAWAALFNSRPRGSDKFLDDLVTAISKAVSEVTEWPAHDLFRHYDSHP